MDKSPFGKGGKGDLKGTTLQQETFENIQGVLEKIRGVFEIPKISPGPSFPKRGVRTELAMDILVAASVLR